MEFGGAHDGERDLDAAQIGFDRIPLRRDARDRDGPGRSHDRHQASIRPG
jgi:hypothetical protein